MAPLPFWANSYVRRDRDFKVREVNVGRDTLAAAGLAAVGLAAPAAVEPAAAATKRPPAAKAKTEPMKASSAKSKKKPPTATRTTQRKTVQASGERESESDQSDSGGPALHPTGSTRQTMRAADMESLSVKELKTELDRHDVDYSGCVEKRELRELLHSALQSSEDHGRGRPIETAIYSGGGRGRGRSSRAGRPARGKKRKKHKHKHKHKHKTKKNKKRRKTDREGDDNEPEQFDTALLEEEVASVADFEVMFQPGMQPVDTAQSARTADGKEQEQEQEQDKAVAALIAAAAAAAAASAAVSKQQLLLRQRGRGGRREGGRVGWLVGGGVGGSHLCLCLSAAGLLCFSTAETVVG